MQKATVTSMLWLAVLLLAGPSYAQNLLQNPGCEEALVGDEVPSWTEVVGSNWICRAGNPDPQEGSGYFFPGAGANTELSQDVEVSSLAATIDAGTQEFTFIGYVRTYNQSNPDLSRIIVEYRDAANAAVLDSYDTGEIANRTAWEQVSDIRLAPVGTRTIRVRLISRRRSGTNNDGYYDDLMLATGNLLPVELVAFEALLDGPAVVLSWRTASETNNAGFVIEQNAVTGWQQVTFIEGHGTTIWPQYYEQRIVPLEPGRHRFRLKQIDYDGTFAYSPEVEVAVAVPDAFVWTPAYPNPFNPQTQVSLGVARRQRVTVEVYNALGQRVRTLYDDMMEAGASRALVFEAQGVPSGLYLIRAVGETFTATQTVMLLR